MICSVLIEPAHSISFTLGAYQSECFFEDLQPDAHCSVRFQVSAATSHTLDVDIDIYNPRVTAVYSVRRKPGGLSVFSVEDPGVYRVCFHTRFASKGVKQIHVDIDCNRPGQDENQDNEEEEVLQADSLGGAENEISALGLALREVYREGTYMKSRLRVHDRTAKSTNERVLLWSLAEAAMCISVGLFQVYWVKNFLEQRRGGAGGAGGIRL